MRILLYSDHRYPAAPQQGCGPHPTAFPSGSGYHLHDLLARGLAESGHDVFYQTAQGADCPMPSGVQWVSSLPLEADVCHALAGPPRFADPMLEFGRLHRKACILTCHMLRAGIAGAPNWVFVSRALAEAHGYQRVVLNGLDPDDYIYSESKQDYLLFMATMDKAIDKGLDLALALSRRKGFRLVVAGTGRTYDTIRRAAEMCAAAGAEYLGDVRGVRKAELIAGARAMLFPSRLKEGCPLVILEAMFSGTPVISSTSGGSVEIVTPETGMLCETDAQWDRAVDLLPDISSAECREIAMERYHYRRMVADYVSEYQRELAGMAG